MVSNLYGKLKVEDEKSLCSLFTFSLNEYEIKKKLN